MKISFTVTITRKLILALVAVSVIGTAAAAMTLFTHHFPGVKLASPPIQISTSCAILVNGTAPILGTSGNLTFDCGGGSPAFTVIATGFTVRPVFSLANTNYTRLAVWPTFLYGQNNNSPTCTGPTYHEIQSGFPLGFASLGSKYIYCAEFLADTTTGFGSFTVVWGQ